MLLRCWENLNYTLLLCRSVPQMIIFAICYCFMFLILPYFFAWCPDLPWYFILFVLCLLFILLHKANSMKYSKQTGEKWILWTFVLNYWKAYNYVVIYLLIRNWTERIHMFSYFWSAAGCARALWVICSRK